MTVKSLAAALLLALVFPAAGATDARERAQKRLETALVLRYEEEMDLPTERSDRFLVRLRACLAEEREYRARRTSLIGRLDACRDENKAPSLVEEMERLDADHYRKKLELRGEVLSVLLPLERVRFYVVAEKINREVLEIVEEVRRSRLPQPLKHRKDRREK